MSNYAKLVIEFLSLDILSEGWACIMAVMEIEWETLTWGERTPFSLSGSMGEVVVWITLRGFHGWAFFNHVSFPF